MTQEQLKTRHVGKQDPKRHLENAVETAMGNQVRSRIAHSLTTIPYCAFFSIKVFVERSEGGVWKNTLANRSIILHVP